jgi:hypothetical protein
MQFVFLEFNWTIFINIANDTIMIFASYFEVALIQSPTSVTLQMSQKAAFLFSLWHTKQAAILVLI